MEIVINLPSGEKHRKNFDQNIVSIGRSSKCDFAIPDESLSRSHCQIEFVDGELYITDLGSTNGVKINGELIKAHKRTLIKSFLEVRIGKIELSASMTSQDSSAVKKTSIPQISIEKSSSSKDRPVKQRNRGDTRSPSQTFSKKYREGHKQKSKEGNNAKVLFFLMVVLLVIYFRDDISQKMQISTFRFNVDKLSGYRKTEKFFNPEEYRRFYDQRLKGNCGKLCENLMLYENLEGSYNLDKVLIIYMDGQKFSNHVELSHISHKEEAVQIFSIRNILKSQSLMQKLQSKEILQIHLVCLYGSSYFNKVYRFSPLKIFQKDIILNNLIELADSSLNFDKTQDFLEETKEVLPSLIPAKK